jgi:hypothetical protein
MKEKWPKYSRIIEECLHLQFYKIIEGGNKNG